MLLSPEVEAGCAVRSLLVEGVTVVAVLGWVGVEEAPWVTGALGEAVEPVDEELEPHAATPRARAATRMAIERDL